MGNQTEISGISELHRLRKIAIRKCINEKKPIGKCKKENPPDNITETYFSIMTRSELKAVTICRRHPDKNEEKRLSAAQQVAKKINIYQELAKKTVRKKGNALLNKLEALYIELAGRLISISGQPFPEGLGLARQGIILDPNSRGAKLLAAAGHAKAGNWQEAEKSLSELASQQPSNSSTAFEKYRLYYSALAKHKLGKLEQSFVTLSNIEKIYPRSSWTVDFHILAGDIYNAKKEPWNGLVEFQRAVKIDKRNAYSHLQLYKSYLGSLRGILALNELFILGKLCDKDSLYIKETFNYYPDRGN